MNCILLWASCHRNRFFSKNSFKLLIMRIFFNKFKYLLYITIFWLGKNTQGSTTYRSFKNFLFNLFLFLNSSILFFLFLIIYFLNNFIPFLNKLWVKYIKSLRWNIYFEMSNSVAICLIQKFIKYFWIIIS